MRAVIPILFASAIIACGVAQGAEPRAQAQVTRGQALVEANCSSCHAVGAREVSRSAQAPAFRTLAQTYPVSHLEEALAEGMSVPGHDITYAFAPNEVTAIVSYLETIQTPRQTRTRPAAVG